MVYAANSNCVSKCKAWPVMTYLYHCNNKLVLLTTQCMVPWLQRKPSDKADQRFGITFAMQMFVVLWSFCWITTGDSLTHRALQDSYKSKYVVLPIQPTALWATKTGTFPLCNQSLIATHTSQPLSLPLVCYQGNNMHGYSMHGYSNMFLQDKALTCVCVFMGYILVGPAAFEE